MLETKGGNLYGENCDYVVMNIHSVKLEWEKDSGTENHVVEIVKAKNTPKVLFIEAGGKS